MKKLVIIALAAVLALILGATAVFAESDQIPSAKAAFQSNYVRVMTATKGPDGSNPDVHILEAKIKTGTPKDLIVDVSAECALLTNVKLRGEEGTEAKTRIEIEVILDEWPGEGPNNERRFTPERVTFAGRVLEIKGDLTHPDDVYPPHEVEIWMKTKSANSFNFCIENVGSGVHTITVVANVYTDVKGLEGKAKAYIGNTTVVVDEVMLKRMD